MWRRTVEYSWLCRFDCFWFVFVSCYCYYWFHVLCGWQEKCLEGHASNSPPMIWPTFIFRRTCQPLNENVAKNTWDELHLNKLYNVGIRKLNGNWPSIPVISSISRISSSSNLILDFNISVLFGSIRAKRRFKMFSSLVCSSPELKSRAKVITLSVVLQ